MLVTVACSFDMPALADAAAARGLRLVPFAAPGEAQVALVRCDGDSAAGVERLRAAGWRGPLMLVLPEGGSVTRALDAGADDAVASPASAGEIAARLAARVRGVGPLVFGPLRIEPLLRQAARDGRPLWLSMREFALLLHLARAEGEVVTRGELLARIWGLGFDPGTNVIDVHVSRLRAKLDRGEAWPMLRTVKGLGYALADGP